MANTNENAGQGSLVNGYGPQSLLQTYAISTNHNEEFECSEFCNITRRDWCDNFNQHVG